MVWAADVAHEGHVKKGHEANAGRSKKEIVTQSFWNRNEKLFVEIAKGQLCRREATEGGGTWQPQNRNLFKPLFLRTTTCYPQKAFSMEENEKNMKKKKFF